MNGKDFKNLKEIKNIYCLVSDDAEMIDLYIARFKAMIKADEINYGSIKSCGRLFKKRTLNVLYLPKLSEDIFTHSEYIFIHTDSIDKRTALYKKYKNQIIEIKNDYTQFILDNSSITDRDKAAALAKINNLGIIKNKLPYYDNQIYGDIFLWVENFISDKDLPDIEESPIAVMALLSSNCHSLIKILDNDLNGLNNFIINKLNKLKSYRTREELYNIIGDCFYLDCQIKKGLIDIKLALKYLICKYYKKEK